MCTAVPPTAQASRPNEGPPPRLKARPPMRESSSRGLAPDAESFESLLTEDTERVRALGLPWTYQVDGRVFGPVEAREVLELLYRGELSETSLVAPEDEPFRPVSECPAFAPYLATVAAHRQRVATQVAAQAAALARTRRRWAVAVVAVMALAALAVVGVGVYRTRQAEADRIAEESRLRAEIAGLTESIRIEPPLLPVAPPATATAKKRSRRRRARARKRVDRKAPTATGVLTRGEIEEGVRAVFPGIKRCIAKQMQTEPKSVPSRLVLSFAIKNDGTATEVRLSERSLRRSALGSCLAAQLARPRWRPFVGEVRNVEYPISIGR